MRRLASIGLLALLAGCAVPAPPCAGLAGRPMLAATLYFGRSSRGAPVDEAAWRAFLAEAVTPRFPSGFTVLDGNGQWRSPASGRISGEPSSVVIVLAEPGAASLAALAAIRADYQRRFAQESVGLALADSCASF